jgi:hypothetical protein
MAHARPFSTSKLHDLFNGIKNTSRRGVLTLVIEFRVFQSTGGLPNLHFGSVSVIFTLLQSGVATIGELVKWLQPQPFKFPIILNKSYDLKVFYLNVKKLTFAKMKFNFMFIKLSKHFFQMMHIMVS